MPCIAELVLQLTLYVLQVVLVRLLHLHRAYAICTIIYPMYSRIFSRRSLVYAICSMIYNFLIRKRNYAPHSIMWIMDGYAMRSKIAATPTTSAMD